MKGNLWMEIRSEKKKGLSYAEIGRKHHIDPRTAKKYAETEEVPKYTLKPKRPSKLDPYKDYIDALLEEDNYSAALILERIRERGCQCGYTIVKDYVSQKKKELNSKATVRFETVPGRKDRSTGDFLKTIEFTKMRIQKTVLLSYDSRIFKKQIYRICYGYEYRYLNSMPHQCIPLLWRISERNTL